MDLLASSTSGSGDRNSRPFWWPGGEGDLHVLGALDGGTVTLYEANPTLATAAIRGDASSYKAQGATITADDGSNRFDAAACWMYVGFADAAADADDFECWVAKDETVPQPYFVDGNPSAVA